MKLYYHKTDGGAEYYSTTHLDDCEEGKADDIIMRTDGDEIEIFTQQLERLKIKLVIN